MSENASDPLHRRINTRGAVQRLNELLEAYRAEAWDNAIKSHGLKDHEIRDMVNELHVTAEQYAGTQQLRERIAQCVLKYLRRGDLRYGLLPILQEDPRSDTHVP